MPTGSFPKFKLEVERLVAALENDPTLTPAPERATDCGPLAALSLRVTAAVRFPVAMGLKATPIVQLVPAPTEIPHVEVWVKSVPFVPVTAMPVMLKTAVPEFSRLWSAPRW